MNFCVFGSLLSFTITRRKSVALIQVESAEYLKNDVSYVKCEEIPKRFLMPTRIRKWCAYHRHKTPRAVPLCVQYHPKSNAPLSTVVSE